MPGIATIQSRRQRRASRRSSKDIKHMDLTKFTGTREFLEERLKEANLDFHGVKILDEQVEALTAMLGPTLHRVVIKDDQKEALIAMIESRCADYERMKAKLTEEDRIKIRLACYTLDKQVEVLPDQVEPLLAKAEEYFVHHIR